jgi:hypothetical protein
MKLRLHLKLVDRPMRERDGESFSLTMCLNSWLVQRHLSLLPTTLELVGAARPIRSQKHANLCKLAMQVAILV